MTIPPLGSRKQAEALPAVRAIYEANREGRATLAQGNAAALREALAGVELGAFDEHVIGWLSDWDVHVIAGALCGLIRRARQAGPVPASCLACGLADPPPEPTCPGEDGIATYHYVGTVDGCPHCGRTLVACALAPCTPDNGGDRGTVD